MRMTASLFLSWTILLTLAASEAQATPSAPFQQTGTGIGIGGDSGGNDDNTQPTNHKDFFDQLKGEAGIETTASLSEGGAAQPVWTPPAWLSHCIVETWLVSEMIGENASLRGIVNARATLPEHHDLDTTWILLHCTPQSASYLRGGTTGITSGVRVGWTSSGYPAGETAPPFIVDYLIIDALTKVRVPVQAGSSAPDGEADLIYYQLPVVTWIDPAVWAPVSASSQLFAGGPSVTVTATPVSASFEARPNESGDAESRVDCEDWATTPWSEARDTQLIAQGCHVTFKRAGDHTLYSEVSWAFEWVCSPGCGSGNFDGDLMVRRNNRSVEVSEFQAVESQP